MFLIWHFLGESGLWVLWLISVVVGDLGWGGVVFLPREASATADRQKTRKGDLGWVLGLGIAYAAISHGGRANLANRANQSNLGTWVGGLGWVVQLFQSCGLFFCLPRVRELWAGVDDLRWRWGAWVGCFVLRRSWLDAGDERWEVVKGRRTEPRRSLLLGLMLALGKMALWLVLGMVFVGVVCGGDLG